MKQNIVNKLEINNAISQLKEINLKIESYNNQNECDEELELFLESEQKRLIKFLTINVMGSNVVIIPRGSA